MYPDHREEQMRKQIRQRYNRRFFLAVHVGTLIACVLLLGLLPALQIVLALGLLALIPHLIYVAYLEYRDWLERKIDRELGHSASDNDAYPLNKRKRYPEGMQSSKRFRLTDDGEIETYSAPTAGVFEKGKNDSSASGYQRRDDEKSRSRKNEKKRRRKDDDTDEFNVKELLEKVKDFLD